MTSPGDPLSREVVAWWCAALVLGGTHLARRRRAPSTRAPRTPRAPTAVTAAVAATGPALAVGRALRGSSGRWKPPASFTGKLLLAGYVGSGALAEELIWRAPLLHARSRRVRAWKVLGSVAGFTAVHVRRDGRRSATIHLPNTLGWTCATLLDGRLGWSWCTHAAYNFVALSLRPEACGAR